MPVRMRMVEFIWNLSRVHFHPMRDSDYVYTDWETGAVNGFLGLLVLYTMQATSTANLDRLCYCMYCHSGLHTVNYQFPARSDTGASYTRLTRRVHKPISPRTTYNKLSFSPSPYVSPHQTMCLVISLINSRDFNQHLFFLSSQIDFCQHNMFSLICQRNNFWYIEIMFHNFLAQAWRIVFTWQLFENQFHSFQIVQNPFRQSKNC